MTRFSPFLGSLSTQVRIATQDLSFSQSQIQQDSNYSTFSSQATDASALALMTLAGFAGRIARAGILSTGARNLLSQFGSVAAEAGVMTVAGSHDPNRSNTHQEFLKHFVNFSIFRLTARTGAACGAPTHHFIQSAAMMAGHHAATFLNLEEASQTSLTQQFFDANLATLQIAVGSRLSARFSGGRLQRLENNLEQLSRFSLSSQHASFSSSLLHPMRSEDGVNEAPGAALPIEELEGRPRDPARQLEEIKRELASATLRFKSLESTLTNTEIQTGYTRELLRLGEHVNYWEAQQKAARKKRGASKDRFIEDILIGQRILHHQVLLFATAMAAEPIAEENPAEWGLRSQLNIFPRPERMPRFSGPAEAPTPNTPGVTILEAAIARDVGFGRDLALWHHQAEALNIIRATLKVLKGQFDRSEAPSIDNLQGNIGIPVGGGKTRLTMAAFAAAIEAGVYREGVDKFLYFTHTDQIHKQNLDEVHRLNEYFKARFGRDLRVTQYKAETKDLSGDLVLVSIPTAGTEMGREGFRTDLLRNLGRTPTHRGGEVTMAAVDEVHHLGLSSNSKAKMWLELMATVREVSPFFYRLGFSGSLSGREGRVLYRLRERALLVSGITPRRYLVQVPGIDLSDIRVSETGEFNQKQMKSALLGHPERNQNLYERVEKWGRRQETLSPSGRARLMGTIGFCDTLEHGRMMVDDFATFFGQPGSDLRGRRIRTLGTAKGVITQREMETALADYRAGKIDAIACLVSGQTRKIKMTLQDGSIGDMTDYILERTDAGEIELTVNDSALKEGANLHMYYNELGARATFSDFVKRQEAGRTNRRSPGELGPNGELLQDSPRVLFDVIDRYYNPENPRTLIRYANVIGCKDPSQARPGELFDVLGDRVVTEIDLLGRVQRPSLEEAFRALIAPPEVPPIVEPEASQNPSTPTTESGSDATRPSAGPPPPPRPQHWRALTQLLRSILEKQFGNDVRYMARYLGESDDYVQNLLRGEGWELNPWYLRRLATLLYQDREAFYEIYRGTRIAPGTEAMSLSQSFEQNALRDFTSLFPRWARKKGTLDKQGLLDAIREFAASRPQHVAFYELLIALYENAQMKSAAERRNADYFREGREGLTRAQIMTLQTELGSITRRFLRE